MNYVTLTTFQSEDQNRNSVVRKSLGETVRYVVSCSDEQGNITSTIFDNLQLAENFAEDFVS